MRGLWVLALALHLSVIPVKLWHGVRSLAHVPGHLVEKAANFYVNHLQPYPKPDPARYNPRGLSASRSGS